MKLGLITGMSKVKTQKGFIAIVAIGMFAVLAIFGIIVQMAVIESGTNMKNADNFYVANDIADSIIEHVQLKLNDHGAGYTDASACQYSASGSAQAMNFVDIADSKKIKDGGAVICETGFVEGPDGQLIETEVCEEVDGDDPPNGNDPSLDNAGIAFFDELDSQFPNAGTELCPQSLTTASGQSILDGKNVKVVVSVQGKSHGDQNLATSNCPGNISNSSCYTMPHPGTGNAGKWCDQYDPDFASDSDGSTNVIVDFENDAVIDQADFSCNWNKLTFGSSSTDRVAIPLYYEAVVDGALQTVSPYKEGLAEHFVLRVRTPCLPCAEKKADGTYEQFETGTKRICPPKQDPTVCSDSDRYDLGVIPGFGSANEKGDEVVLQWKIQGKCTGPNFNGEQALVDCAAIPVTKEQGLIGLEADFSAIYESTLNIGLDGSGSSLVLNNSSSADIAGTSSSLEEYTINTVLQDYEAPTFTLLLVNQLISDYGKNVPYLEYQLVTDFPISSPGKDVTVIINVDGNIVQKEIEVKENIELIDFAIQSS